VITTGWVNASAEIALKLGRGHSNLCRCSPSRLKVPDVHSSKRIPN